MTRLSILLDEIDSSAVLLPEFQRGYVWNRDQVTTDTVSFLKIPDR